MNKFRVKVGDTTFEIHRDADAVLKLNGKATEVEYFKIAPRRYLLRLEGVSYDILAQDEPAPGKEVSMLINGRPVNMEIDDATTLMLRRYADTSATRIHAAVLRAPMPGRISRVMVRKGELVEAGQGLIVLEAMKMENELKSPTAGIIKSILVSETAAVEKNALLIEIS